MQIKVKLLSVGGVPASDGSVIPREVFEAWLNDPETRKDIEAHKLLGSMSHLCRSKTALKTTFNQAAASTIGNGDSMLLVGNNTAPTHYIDDIWVDESDLWVHCSATLLDPSVMDDEAAQNIKRLSGLLINRIHPGVSAVILGFWSNDDGSGDRLKKLVKMRGFDVTLSPSWTKATVTDIIEEGEDKEEFYSEVGNEGEMKAKMFSDLSIFGLGKDFPKSSKIGGSYTTLKAKVFSTSGEIQTIDFADYTEPTTNQPVEKLASETPAKEEIKPVIATGEKTFSVMAIKERLRYAKFSPRMRMRRLFIEYKQLVKQSGGIEKMKPEDVKILKSMFVSEINMLFNQVTPEILAGKQINTLLGCSSLGKSLRQASQKLMIPYRMGFQEIRKNGSITPTRFKAIKAAYEEFIQALLDEVFGSSAMPEGLEEETELEEKGGIGNVKS